MIEYMHTTASYRVRRANCQIIRSSKRFIAKVLEGEPGYV